MPALNNSTKSMITYGVKLAAPIIASKALKFSVNYCSGGRDFSKIVSDFKNSAVDGVKTNWIQPYINKNSQLYTVAEKFTNYAFNYFEEQVSAQAQKFIINDPGAPKDIPSFVSYGAIKLLQLGIEHYSQSENSEQKSIENSSPQLLLEDGEVNPANSESNQFHTESLANSYVSSYEDKYHQLDQFADDDIEVFGDCIDSALDGV